MANYLRGRGHRVVRAAAALLSAESDAVIVDYALANDLVIVTFDADLRSGSVRKGCRVLWIDGPEWTARDRVATHYGDIIGLLNQSGHLVSLPDGGPPFAGELVVKSRRGRPRRRGGAAR